VAIVSAYPPDRGRLSEYAGALVGALLKLEGLSVEVLSDAKAAPSPSLQVRPIWRPDDGLSLLRLWLAVLRSRHRLIHFNLHLAVFGRSRLANFLGLLTPLWARLSGKRVLVTLHNLHDTIRLEETPLRPTALNRLGLTLAVKLLALAADALVVTMRLYVPLLRRRYGARRVVWIPHGCWFTDLGPRYSWSGRGEVLFLGYLAPYKDLVALVKALELLARRRRVRLLIAGTVHPNFLRESRQSLERLRALPFVRYLGFVSDERLPGLLSEVDLAVLPYRTSTGTSGVLHLISALGVPAVASDTPEFRELAREGAGLVIAPLDPPSLSSAIERVLEDRALARSLSRRAVQFAASRSWALVARRYASLFLELLKGQPA
jgi:glycosyltransferase involved in cell wall biosynthesis